MKRDILIYYKFALLMIWMAVIFMLSSEVSNVSSGRSDAIVRVVSSTLHLTLSQEIMAFLVRKSAHIIAYFVLGLLVFNVAKDLKFKRIRYAIMVSILFTMIYAISDELHQLFVSGRSCELRDVAIDTIAATAGIIVCHLFYNTQNKLHKLQK